MAELQELEPATVHSNIFEQFDVQKKEGFSVAGSHVYQYVCLLSPCVERQRILKSRHGWHIHRVKVHNTSEDQNLPNGWQIHQWVERGKPRPYEVPVKAKPQKKPGLRARLLLHKPGMVELQPATSQSNIYEQFDVRLQDGRPVYTCLIPPCFGDELGFENHLKWRRHRKNVHRIPAEENLPSAWEIRVWVGKQKPRPYDVPVKPKPQKFTQKSLEPEIFEQVDIKVTADGKAERFFCLLDPCKQKGISVQDRRGWKVHRTKVHKLNEDGIKLPGMCMLRDWVRKGKPLPYQIPPEFLPYDVEASSSGAGPSKAVQEIETQQPWTSAELQVTPPPELMHTSHTFSEPWSLYVTPPETEGAAKFLLG